MNLPNRLTVFRIILIPFFLVALLGQVFGRPVSDQMAAVIFVLASLTDWLDGYLARKFDLVTNFGKFMDPMADKLLVCSALIALIQTHGLSAWVTVLIIGRELFISAFRLVAVEQGVVIAAGKLGKGKTAATMIMIVLILVGVPAGVANFFVGLSVALTLLSAFEYMYANRKILEQMNGK